MTTKISVHENAFPIAMLQLLFTELGHQALNDRLLLLSSYAIRSSCAGSGNGKPTGFH
ncbi:hypothetical protein [Lacibacter sp.]|uniref:hypothetical protein n=1 Tax=Lacibacter sp. TaxID=1915409 RepID=UPI002B4AAE78|nr:hypothetical protein [Lacibacter sp.]HLP39449.1 hypothetical protein [Lacibacter sp.]